MKLLKLIKEDGFMISLKKFKAEFGSRKYIIEICNLKVCTWERQSFETKKEALMAFEDKHFIMWMKDSVKSVGRGEIYKEVVAKDAYQEHKQKELDKLAQELEERKKKLEELKGDTNE